MKYVFLFLFTAISFLSFGQSKKLNFKFGEAYTAPNYIADLSFFGNDKDGIIDVYSKNAKLTIVRFDAKTLKFKGEKTIEIPDASKNFNSEAAVSLNGNCYWIHSDWNRGDQKELLAYNKIDVEKGALMPGGTNVIEAGRMIADMVPGGIYQSKAVNKYGFTFSADNKKMLMSYRLMPEKGSDRKTFNKAGLHVFDENMNKLWGTEFMLPYAEKIIRSADYTLDNNGNVYMLVKVYNSGSRDEENKEKKPDYHYEVLKFTKDSKQVIQAAVPAGDNFINNAKLQVNERNEIFITAVYSKKYQNGNSDGIFLSVLDQQDKISPFKNGFYPFPVAELSKFESPSAREKMQKNNDYSVPNLQVRQVIAEADGSTIIACEQYHDFDSPGQSIYIHFLYDNVFVAKIAADGKLEWVRKIPKRQEDLSPHTLSYKLLKDNTGYYFLYVDNINNLNLAEDETPKLHIHRKGGQVMLTKIDNSGVITKEVVFDVKNEENIVVEPTDFKRVNANQYIGRAGIVKGLQGLNGFKLLLMTVN